VNTHASDPRRARVFRFVRAHYDDIAGVAELVYAFDDDAPMTERIIFPGAPAVDPRRRSAIARALRVLHLIAGVSYYKAGVPPVVVLDEGPVDADIARLIEAVYEHGLGEFAYENGLDLRGRVRLPVDADAGVRAPVLGLPARTLVPLGGGKDSLVTVEALRAAGINATVVHIGRSELIQACAELTGLPRLNVLREISPALFELNRRGAWNGHIPVTAINSAILVMAALVYGYDAIAFSNERSASAPTRTDGAIGAVNHQWSKGWDFEQAFAAVVCGGIAADLAYWSALRPWSELAVTAAFSRLTSYHGVFSSCNRNFKILGTRPQARWCGQCPKCHFVYAALAPFLPKPSLTAIFGRNLLDDPALIPAYDGLMEWHAAKPFECVGEARETRVALAVLAGRAEWREDAVVARFAREILPQLSGADTHLAALLEPAGPHAVPAVVMEQVGALVRA
jgi:hypothetical protein